MEIACKGSFRLLFSLLNLSEEPRLQQLVLEVSVAFVVALCAQGLLLIAQVIVAVAGNRDCVTDIAESSVLVYLLFSLNTFPSGECVFGLPTVVSR